MADEVDHLFRFFLWRRMGSPGDREGKDQGLEQASQPGAQLPATPTPPGHPPTWALAVAGSHPALNSLNPGEEGHGELR